MENNRRRNTLERDREKIRQRRKQRRNRRRNKKILTVFSVLGIILIAVMTFFYVFRVTNVKVAGNTRHSDDMIIQYVQRDLMTTNTMLASLFRKSMEVEDIPFVESLDIEALDNNTIRIYVNEKQIVGYVIENDHKLFFDKDGYVLEIMPMAEAELQGIQAEMERFEQLRREEEGLPPEGEINSPEGEQPEGELNQPEGEQPEGELNPSEGEDPEGEVNSPEGENPEGELNPSEGETPDEEVNSSEDASQQGLAPQVPWILGLDRNHDSIDTQIIVEDSSVFNTIQGIWRISSKYKIIPERVLFDEAYNITLVYQNGNILCELGPDTILEEKMTRVAAILPNLTDKIGILHLEDYVIGTEGIIFSQESEYTVMSKINKFLKKNS